MNGSSWLRIGAGSGALVVVLGAFLAHSLRVPDKELDLLPLEARHAAVRRMEVFETGARYQMYHALAIVGVGLASIVSDRSARRRLDLAGWAFLAGSVLFSGSLYALGLGGPSRLGLITPLGGLGFIVGWGLLASCRVGASGRVAAGDHFDAGKETVLMS